MGRAKEISLKIIPAKIATPFVKRHHYSGTVVNNSQLHFGAFLDGRLHGVLSFGSSMDKSKLLVWLKVPSGMNFWSLIAWRLMNIYREIAKVIV